MLSESVSCDDECAGVNNCRIGGYGDGFGGGDGNDDGFGYGYGYGI